MKYIPRVFAFMLITLLVVTDLSFQAFGRITRVDNNISDLSKFFTVADCQYVIKHSHVFREQLVVPRNCSIKFDGGSLSGPICFTNTTLIGDVKLQGSTLSGKIRNNTFETSWNCFRDGITDDAPNLRSAINVADTIHFKKGNYILSSRVQENVTLAGKLNSPNNYCIVITNPVCLIGDEGANLINSSTNGMICIYSAPETCVDDVTIKGLTFTTKNTGESFHEFYHSIFVSGVRNLIIDSCCFNDFWGDAICIGTVDEGVYKPRPINSEILISNNVIEGGKHHNTRNGVSIGHGSGITVVNNIIRNTSAPKMPGAIDVEPDNKAMKVTYLHILNNTIEGCSGTAGGICLNANFGDISHVLVCGNSINKCFAGLSFVVKREDAMTDCTIIDNVLNGNNSAYQFVGNGSSVHRWSIKNNIVVGSIKSWKQWNSGSIKIE